MVKHFGYCPSLRKKVDFEVSEVVDIPTKRGIKYQIKGNYEGRLCNTFCSASKAQELRTQIGSPKIFTVMEAEESQENLGQATQEESVPPIIGPSEKAYGQEGEAAQELPLAETVPTPIISADDMSVQPIDDLSLPDATLADMQETLDVPPTMDADFEIAEIQPEGDGSSIGNIAPMNPDAPLHAEDFDAEESQENLGQATQEESVPAIIGPSQEAYGQEGEAAQELPLAETVPTPIISAVDMNVEPIDSLSSFNGGDILSQMESNLGERPEIMADFAIRPYQLFGQGRSIGNIAPMNPDVPFASEDDDDDDDNFDAESIPQIDIELMAQVPPPVCFAEKIPPSVWENTSLQGQLDYASSKNEGLLNCPQCGISKAELRSQGGYCGTTDPEGEEYISSRSCPYEKYFAPQHWVDEPQVISHITPERIVLEDTLMAEVDMPAIDPIMAAVETRVIPKGLFYQINSMLPDGVMANQTIDGMSYELSYYGMDTEALDKVLDIQFQGYDMMFGAETFEAPKSRLSKKQQETLDYIKESTMRTGRAYITGETYNMRVIRNLFDKKLIKFDREDNQYKYNWKKPSRVIENDGVYYVVPTSLGNEYTYRFPYGNYQYSSMKEFYDNQKPVFDGTTQTLDEVLDELFGAEEVNYPDGMDWEVYAYRTTEKLARDARNEAMRGRVKRRQLRFDYKIEKAPDKEGWNVLARIKRAETFEAESKKKPSKTAEKAILTGASTGATMEIADALLAAETFEGTDFEGNSAVIRQLNSQFRRLRFLGMLLGDDVKSLNDLNKKMDMTHPSLYVKNRSNNKSYLTWLTNEQITEELGLNKENLKQLHDEWGVKLGSKLQEMIFDLSYTIHDRMTSKQTHLDAETFDVEFDDWADQEMKSHGDNISFKKWAKEEGEKHGDVPLTDWAEHEEESHDERYGAENCEHFWDVARDGENYNRCLNCGITNERYGAENFESQSAQTKMKPPIKSIGILLGLGAIAAVVAPENLKKMFKR